MPTDGRSHCVFPYRSQCVPQALHKNTDSDKKYTVFKTSHARVAMKAGWNVQKMMIKNNYQKKDNKSMTDNNIQRNPV